MTFGNPDALWLLPALPFLLLGLGLFGWMRKREVAAVFRLNLRSLLRGQVRKYATAGVLMILLTVALALPRVPYRTAGVPKRTGQVILLLDVSASMAAQSDLASPNRLMRVKSILYDAVDKLETLKEVEVSVHGFTSIARSLVPFVGSEDYAYLRESIKKVVGVHSVPGSGSSLGRSLSNVLGKFSSGDTAKLIVLFSDGEPFIGVSSELHEVEIAWFEEAVQEAREQGIKVITVGVGEPEGARIPLYDMTGFTGEYAQLYEGADYVSYFEAKRLEELAARTGGRYFFEDSLQGFTEYVERNLTLASSGGTAEEVTGYRDIAPGFAGAAVPFLVLLVRRHLLA